MTLDDIYMQLAGAELRNVVLGTGAMDKINGEIPRANYEKILPMVKLGLTELHKRFLLRDSEFTLTLVPGKVSYLLAKAYAMSNADAVSPYINDTADPLTDNLMRVERIYGILDRKEYRIPFNRAENPESIRTSLFNNILVPEDPKVAPWVAETTALRIVYRADHPEINISRANAAPGRIPIYLPTTHLEALIYHIASRAINPNGIIGEAFHEGNNYAAKFEAAVVILKQMSFEIEQTIENTKLHDRGFC